jgi:hypothetical protein
MAGRPRLYKNAAEKARAYRERQQEKWAPIQRDDFERLQEHLKRLRLAVYAAEEVGDALASSLKTVTYEDLLAGLAKHFEDLAVHAEANGASKERQNR